MLITELKGRAQVFTTKSGKTFRIFAHATRTISDNEVSKEMHIAKNMGLILMSSVNEEVPKNKKSGGTK